MNDDIYQALARTALLIDTDIFIAAKNLHYGMDFCPAFWDWLIATNKAGRLLSIAAVHDDQRPGEGDAIRRQNPSPWKCRQA